MSAFNCHVSCPTGDAHQLKCAMCESLSHVLHLLHRNPRPLLHFLIDFSSLHSMASPYLLLLLLIPVLPLIFLLVLAFLARPRPAKVPVKGRHVFITGGSSGIGLAMALQAALEGARVSILARNQAKLEEARDTIRLATGKEVTILSADVRDAESVARAIEEAGPIDILIANQGVFIPQELELQDMKEIRFQVEVNLMGTFHLIKAALPGMRQNTRKTGLPASIAIISSQAGQV